MLETWGQSSCTQKRASTGSWARRLRLIRGGAEEPVSGVSPYGIWLATDGDTLFTTTYAEKLIPWDSSTGSWVEETAISALPIPSGYARFSQGVAVDRGQVVYGLQPTGGGYWVGVATKDAGTWVEKCRARWSGVVTEPLVTGHAGLPVDISGDQVVFGGVNSAVVLELQ